MTDDVPNDAKFFTPAEGMVLHKPMGGEWQRADGKPLSDYDRAIIAGEKAWEYWDRKDREAEEAKNRREEG